MLTLSGLDNNNDFTDERTGFRNSADMRAHYGCEPYPVTMQAYVGFGRSLKFCTRSLFLLERTYGPWALRPGPHGAINETQNPTLAGRDVHLAAKVHDRTKGVRFVFF